MSLEFKKGRAELKQFVLDGHPRDRVMPRISRLPKQERQLATLVLEWALNPRAHLLNGDPLLDLGGLTENAVTKVFSVFFPGLETAALATWKSLAIGPYCDFISPNVYRSPQRSDLTIRKQLIWLAELVHVFVKYRTNVTSAEGLAVWAPYLDDHQELFGPFGPSFDGDEIEDHVGRLLASVIDDGGNQSQRVWDALCMTLERRHSSSMFGGHVIRAFWRCKRYEAHDRLQGVLNGYEDNSSKRRKPSLKMLDDPRYFINIDCILRGVTESTPANLKKVLQLLYDHRCLLNDRLVVSNVVTWLGIGFNLDPVYLRDNISAAIKLLESPVGDSNSGQSLYFRIWRRMIDDVESCRGMLSDLLQHPAANMRLAGIDLAVSTKHPSVLPLVAERFADEDVQVAAHAAFANISQRGTKVRCEKSREESLRSLIRLFERALKLGRKLKPTIKMEPKDFFLRIGHELKNRWTTESLALLGECWTHSPSNCLAFLPSDYVPPDPISVEVLLTQVEPFQNLTGNEEFTDNSAVFFLMRAKLTPKNWCELIRRIDFNAEKLPIGLLQVFSGLSGIEFENATRMLLSNSTGTARIAGLKVINQCLGGPHHEICLRMAQDLRSSHHPQSNLEAALGRQILSQLP